MDTSEKNSIGEKPVSTKLKKQKKKKSEKKSQKTGVSERIAILNENSKKIIPNVPKKVSKKVSKKDPKKLKNPKKKKRKKKPLKVRIAKRINIFKEMLLGESKRQKNNTKIYWGKSFAGLLLVFFIYSLMLISNIKGSVEVAWINILFYYLTLGNPYIMGVSMVFMFIEYMILFSNTKFKEIFFESKKAWIIQILITLILVLSNFYIWKYFISNGINVMPTLFVLAMFWLIFQGLKLFYGARTFSTKVESKIVSRYSPIRFLFVLMVPFIILIFLTLAVWSYRYYLVRLTLDLLSYLTPEAGLRIYSQEMRLILPFLYISLIIIFVLISLTYIFTIRKSENRRSGVFDNFAYSLIVLVMFIYLLFQISMYIGLNEDTVYAINVITEATGRGSNESSYLFWIEYAISMIFLFRAIKGVGKTFGWNAYFLNQDAMVMGFLATIMAQTTSRLALFDESLNQELSGIYGLLKMDHLIIPFLIMLILGLTLIVYYLKPQETSMFMRIATEGVKKSDKSMEIILKFLKQEFIRRGVKFPISEVESQLASITDLKKGLVLSLVSRIGDKYMDVSITEEKTESGTERYIDFLSLVEKYQKGSVASTRAKTYMSNRLTDTLSKEKKKISLSKKKVTSIKERETFMSALGTGFTKKVKEEAKRETLAFTSDLMTTEKGLTEDTIDIIYQIIKNEYLYRVRHTHQYDNVELNTSDIAKKIFNTTKISSGALYPILETLAEKNVNILVIDTDGDQKTNSDKIIDFCPIYDFEISDVIQQYRPEKLAELTKLLSFRLENALLNRPNILWIQLT